MRTSIIRIGNSRGIRIPKIMLDECHLGDAVELEAKDGQLVIRAAGHPRAGWEEACRMAAAEGIDDELQEWLDAPLTDWDKTEWQW